MTEQEFISKSLNLLGLYFEGSLTRNPQKIDAILKKMASL